MLYEVRNYSGVIGTEGLSETLLRNHFTLYEGYVKNTNVLLEKLAAYVQEDKAASPEYAELKRRFGWEFNGMRLHEYYFGNMTKGGAVLSAGGILSQKIAKDFGSVAAWEKEFKASGSMRGIGWVVLFYDPRVERLHNGWINEHDLGCLVGAVPLLVMDVFEHAFMIDYGLKRASYIEAFFKAIDWTAAEKRFQEVLS